MPSLRRLIALWALATPFAGLAGEAPDAWSTRRVPARAYALYCQGLQLAERATDCLRRREKDKALAYLKSAVATLKQALEVDPQSAAILVEMGSCYLRLAKTDEAIDCLKRAVARQPENGRAHHTLFLAYGGLRRHKDALRSLENAARAADRPRGHEGVVRELIRIHRGSGDFDKAIHWLNFYLQCGYYDRGLHVQLGGLHLQQRRYDQALETFRAAIRRSTSSLAPATAVARAYVRLSEADRNAAIKHHEAVVAKGADPPRREVLAMAYQAAGRRDDMLHQLELAAAAKTPRAEQQKRFVAEYYEQLHRYAKAIEWRKSILEDQEAPSSDALVRLANLQIKHLQMPEAIATFRKALAADPQRKELRPRIAQCYVQLQDWDRAAAVMEEHLNKKTLQTRDARTIFQLGELYDQAGKRELAQKRKQQAISLVRDDIRRADQELSDAELYTLLAEIAYADDRPEDALAHLHVAQKLDPKDGKKLLLLAGAYKRVQQWQDAADTFREFLAKDDQSIAAAGTLAELAECLESLGKDKEAADARRRTAAVLVQILRKTKQDPAKAVIHAELARLAFARNHAERAIRSFLEALALHPANLRYHLGLAVACQSLADWTRAAAHYKSFLASFANPDDPDSAIYVYRLGVAQSRSGQPALGRKNIERAVRILDQALATLKKERRGTPAYKAAVLRDLGYIHSAEKRHDEAERAARRALELAPSGERVRAQLLLASILQDKGQFDDCERTLRDALKREPKSPNACNHLGYFYAERGVKLDQAVTLVKRALHYEPLNGAYLDSLGWAYYKQGKFQQALDLLKKALLYEEDGVIRDHLGDACLKLGNLDEARKAWTKAHALDPTIPGVREKIEKHKPKPPGPKPPTPEPTPPPKAPPASKPPA